MKVLFATYPVAFHTPGGGEIQLLAYQKHLSAYGVDVTLFNQWEPRFLDHDIVHFFSCIGGSIHFCHFVKQIGLPLLISASLWITEETKHLYPIEEIRAQLLLADLVITNSDMECDTLSKVLSLPREKFVTIYNGVEEIFFDKPSPDVFRREFGINDRFVLNVGNIEPRKNQLKLAEAIHYAPEHKLVIIGHVRDADYCQQVMKIGGDKVIYLGPLPHDSVLLRSAYQACDVFCLPSTLETPGLAALEAHAAGCRIAITEVGSTREYFSNSVVYLDPKDVVSIAQAIRDALIFQNLGDEHDSISQSICWSSVISPLVNIYASVSS